MGRDLTNLYIDQSFQHILQISGSDVNDGTGSLVDLLNVTASNATSASYAVTASFALNAGGADTGSLLVTASAADATITFTKGDSSTFDVTVNNVANAISAIGATNTDVQVKNLEATQIDKGTPLFFTDSGTSGNIVGVYRADAANPARMPAGGIAGEDIAPEAEGQAFLDGYIGGVDTSLFTSGDIVYVKAGGGYINQRPTGSAVQVQALGYVAKSAINGSGVIKGPGVANDIPNLPTGQVIVGDGGGTYQFATTSSLSVAFAVSASYATSASYEIIKEVSSSYADYAKQAGYATSSLSSSYAVSSTLALSASHATTASYALNGGTWDGQYSGSANITGSLTIKEDVGTALRIKGQGTSPADIEIVGYPDFVTSFDGGYIGNISSIRGIDVDSNSITFGPDNVYRISGSSASDHSFYVNGDNILRIQNQDGGSRGMEMFGNELKVTLSDSGSNGLFIDYYGDPTSRAQVLFSVGGYRDGLGDWLTTSTLVFGQSDQAFFSAEGDFYVKNIAEGTGSITVWSENNLTLRGDTGVVIQGDDPNTNSDPIDIYGKAFADTISSNINGFSITVNNLNTVRDNTRAFVETPLQIAPGGTVVVGTNSTLKVINEL